MPPLANTQAQTPAHMQVRLKKIIASRSGNELRIKQAGHRWWWPLLSYYSPSIHFTQPLWPPRAREI